MGVYRLLLRHWNFKASMQKQLSTTIKKIVGSPTKRPLLKVEVKKYRDADSTQIGISSTASKIEQGVPLLDGLRSEVFAGDSLDIPYKVQDSIENLKDLESGVETHILLYPSGDEPPERFVIASDGYGRMDWNYKVRYDDPDITEVLTHSPKKIPKLPGASKEYHIMQYRQFVQTQEKAAAAVAMAWQETPGTQ